MEEEKKYFSSEIMKGTYISDKNGKNLVWVKFTDDTRKFFERSYYGNVYNANMDPILDIFENYNFDITIEEDQAQLSKNLPLDKTPSFIVFDLIEALYLIEREKLEVTREIGESIGFNELIEIGMESHQRLWQKYIVYRDIRQRGYIVRVGFGSSADFRVFARGAKFIKDSAKFVYFLIQDGIPVALNELESVVNQVLGDRKKLILAIFDKLGDSTFYQLQRFKFKPISNFKDNWKKETIVSLKQRTNQ